MGPRGKGPQGPQDQRPTSKIGWQVCDPILDILQRMLSSQSMSWDLVCVGLTQIGICDIHALVPCSWPLGWLPHY